MNSKVEKVKAGYSSLEYDERKEIREFIEEFEKKEYKEKRWINEDLKKSLGPISSAGCPCCGN